MTLVISVFEQGMIYAIMALGMYTHTRSWISRI